MQFHPFLRGLMAAAVVLSLSACGGSNSSGSSAAPSTPTTPTTGPSVTTTIQPGQVVSATLPQSSLSFNFGANTVNQPTTITVTAVSANALPQPFNKSAASMSKAAGTGAGSIANSGNVYVTAFSISTSGQVTTFNVPITLSGSVSTTLTAGTTLNLAMLQNNSWVVIGTVVLGPNGTITQGLSSVSLPGIVSVGTYLLYQPAAGSSTAVSNLGVALLADDTNGALQVVNLFDAQGNPLATPTFKSLKYDNASDLDGQAMTPDGSQGVMVDGGNTVRFFSNVQTGVPLASTNTLNIAPYGYHDGDSVAIMPNGDEAVISGDADNSLLLVSGIAAGNPQAASSIPIPSRRDGLVISSDGQVMLARGPWGLTVFSIAPVTPAAGSLGGSVSHSYTQMVDLPNYGAPRFLEDGRDGMAMSPVDSGRAIVIGDLQGVTNVTLFTGLPLKPVAASTIALSGVTMVRSVAISPDGKSAVIGTDAGLVLVTGIDTGTLSQVGTVFAPAIAANNGAAFANVTTIGITLDGKYVVAGSSTQNVLLTIPFTSSGFSAPVGQVTLNVPDNDQMVLH